MSLFAGKRALRHQFEKLTGADLVSATDKSSALLLIKYGNYGRFSWFDNTIVDAGDVGLEIGLVVVHPEADPSDDDNRLEWIEIPALRVINYGTGEAPGISFDPGTRIYAYVVSGTPAGGKLSLAVWG